MPDTIRTALLFLITTLFDIYLFILMVRIILVWVGANYFDPIVQFIAKSTDFLIKPLRRVIPNVYKIETSSILILFLIEILKFLLISLLSFGMPSVIGLIIMAFGDALKILFLTFFYAILLQAILSWMQPNSAINRTLFLFTSPVMRPFQKLIPPVSGIDISPIPALIILQLMIIILVNPILALGLSLAF